MNVQSSGNRRIAPGLIRRSGNREAERRRLVRCIWSLVFLAALLVAWAPSHPVQAQTLPQGGTIPRFESGPCSFKKPENFSAVEGQDFSCGTLVVPERYEQPDGPTLRLAVVIIKATTNSVVPDPVVFAQGGPGGSTIDYYTQVLFTSRIRRNRDMILFDQRGTLYAQPKLFCPEAFDESVKELPLNLSIEETNKRQNEAVLACRARLISEGVNLAAYNSVENANDIESLRQAMGYKQINLYGVSYGTLLALHAMRQHPDGLRSVIIDSVVPPTVNFNFEAPRSQDRAFKEFFKACQQDADCQASYPDLEKFFYDLVARLNKTPVTLHVTDSESGQTHAYLLTGDRLIDQLFQMLYASELLPFLPKMIHNIAAGNYSFLERIASQILFDRTVSYGMYYSVVCAEGGTMDPSQISYAGIRPELARDADVDNRALVQLCTSWKVPALDPGQDAPVQSDIPTLVFNGRFDPITPPAYGQEAAKTLAHSYLFTFPNTGHGALTTSECADSIFLEFLSHPGQAPDGSCIDQLPAVSFMNSKTVIDLPVAIQILTLDKGLIPASILFGLGMIGLLSAGLVFPVLWIFRLLQGKPGRETPALAHLSPWLPVLNAGTLLVFLAVLLVALFRMASANDTSYLFGMPAREGPLLLLPLFSLVLSLATILINTAGWFGRYWSVWRKIYAGLISFASLATLAVLFLWGFFTALIAWIGSLV